MNKILVIEDTPEHFYQLKEYLEETEYVVVPDSFNEMGDALDPRKPSNIKEFTIRKIKENHKELCLIFCDIKFGKNDNGGVELVKEIRNYSDVSLQYYTSLIPIIGYTEHWAKHNEIIVAGADYVMKKDFEMLKEGGEKREAFGYIVGAQIKRFINIINSKYPKELLKDIIDFKEKKRERAAFIMSSYSENHLELANRIMELLRKNGVTGYLAKDNEESKSLFLWREIETLMHGCDFGIALLAPDDREGREKINSNMLLEMGYMLALQKTVLLVQSTELNDFIPTDIKGFKKVVYKDEEELNEKLKKKLRQL